MRKNILEDYDHWEFSKFVKEKTFIKFEKDAEYLFIIYPKEDHEEMLKDLDFIKCIKHNFVKGSYFCNTCKSIICEHCFNY